MAKELHIRIDDIIGAYSDAFGFVFPGFMAFMVEGMLEANPDAEELVVHVDTPGGDVFEGFSILNRLEDFKNAGNVVTTINEGMAASMGSVIMQAASPGRRFARRASTYMMHSASYPYVEYANSAELRATADQLDKIDNTLIRVYTATSGNTPEQIRAHMAEAMFIGPDEAIERNYIDAILEDSPSITKKTRELKAVAFYNPKNINPLNTNMAETKKPSKWDQFVALAKNLFEEGPENNDENEAPKPVAAETELEGGGILYHEGELAEGIAVFTDVEMTTPAADGDHKLTNGKTITVAEGKVTAIADAEDPAANALAEKDAEIQNLKDQLAAKDSAQASLQNQVNDLSTQITNLKKAVPGGGDKTPTPPQNFKGENKSGAHPLDKAAKQIKF